jgi:benzoyl-CoA-dihydrodiol lyase
MHYSAYIILLTFRSGLEFFHECVAANPPAVWQDEQSTQVVDFRTERGSYRHWKLEFDGVIASLTMDVAEDGGLRPGYKLKFNSYDLGVDIELHDAIQRIRFEHAEVRIVVI